MKLELFKKITFHDSEITEYEKDGNNIMFLVKDVFWTPNKCFKIKLKDIRVEVMNNEPKLICYILDYFEDIFKKGRNYHIDHGEVGIQKENNKYNLKIWIDYPQNLIWVERPNNEYFFDKFSVNLCNDYDDTGDLYIKFIMDDFDIEEF